MDKRSWPWKKKSSDKQALDKAVAVLDSSTIASVTGSTQVDMVKNDSNKKPKHVQISMESYTHMTELEDQVKSYEEEVRYLETEVKELNDKLSTVDAEMINKENLVKQHAKVAEEAVSGWEKAEAEAASLKDHLESVTLLRLTAEDRASHLDAALKECMKQIRNLKEEHDKKLQDIILNKAKQYDKMKIELEAKIANLDQEIMVSAAENTALSRSLQERSQLLMKMNEEKSQAQGEIQLLKVKIESFEKEVHSLQYELHVSRKELEIRCEEKNMSLRSAEVANKQHLEGAKKIAKLEAECQRLRGLVRKKLPGPGAVAQMKLEVESLGRDYCELRRSPVKTHPHHFSQLPEFSSDNALVYQKENELLTERLVVMEEEMKMVKEALSKRNSELHACRSLCAETTSKLQSLETQVSSNGEQRNPVRGNAQIPIESFFTKKGSNPASFTLASEDGNDDHASSTGSWPPRLISDPSNIKNEKTYHLGLMEDFLEMEKLACLSLKNSSVPCDSLQASALAKNENSSEVTMIEAHNFHETPEDCKQQIGPLICVKLQSQISMVLESISNDKDLEKVVENVKLVMQDMLESLERKGSNHQLDIALSQLCNFVTSLGDETIFALGATPRANGLNQKANWFSVKYGQAISSEIDVIDFVLDISHVLSEASEMHFNVVGFKTAEGEAGSSVYIDKVALPENKIVPDSSMERYPNGIVNCSDSASDLDVTNDGNIVPLSELTTSSWKCSLEEFEQLKLERDNLVADLAKCVEDFQSARSSLLETENQLAEVESRLAVALKSNSLAETQLKCMAESYKSLETRAEELRAEVDLLQRKIEILDSELQEERKSHQDAAAKFNDLQKQHQSVDCLAATDKDNGTSQEELAAATEKLAECQETIFLLGKQLKALRPQTETRTEIRTLQDNQPIMQDDEEPAINGTNSGFSPSRFEANDPPKSPTNPMHSRPKSGSSSTPTPEKQARGISRFFYIPK